MTTLLDDLLNMEAEEIWKRFDHPSLKPAPHANSACHCEERSDVAIPLP